VLTLTPIVLQPPDDSLCRASLYTLACFIGAVKRFFADLSIENSKVFCVQSWQGWVSCGVCDTLSYSGLNIDLDGDLELDWMAVARHFLQNHCNPRDMGAVSCAVCGVAVAMLTTFVCAL
jgi:hypothetical protein